MTNMMGGITGAYVIPVSKVTSLAVIGDRAWVKKKAGARWTPLTLRVFSSDMIDEPQETDDGLSHKTTATLPVIIEASNAGMAIRGTLLTGCLVRLDFADGSTHVMGSPQHPVHGVVVMERQKKASDTAGQTLRLSTSEPLHTLALDS